MSIEDEANADHNELGEMLVGMAINLLEKNGEFYPIAAEMSADGEARYVIPNLEDEHPDSQVLIDYYIASLRKEASAGSVRAAAIAYDTFDKRDGGKRDAIAIRHEHRDGEPLIMVTPYRVANGEVVFDEGYIQDTKPLIFLPA